MPVVQDLPATPTPVPTSQSNLEKMIGEVQDWNPDCGALTVKTFLRNQMRDILDTRLWSGCLFRGQLNVAAMYSTGSVTVATGSATVQGTGTAFTADMVGRQFRVAMTYPRYTIIAVNTGAQTLTLNMNWGDGALASTGFQIFESIVSLGTRVKFVLSIVNLIQRWRLRTNIPQAFLDTIDPGRLTIGYPRTLADYLPSSAGGPQYELYPACTITQAFPFIAYNQPSDLENDDDTPPLWIRSDVLVKGAIADAVMYRKDSKYYNPNVAAMKKAEQKVAILQMMSMDDASVMRSLVWDWGRSYPEADLRGGSGAQDMETDAP